MLQDDSKRTRLIRAAFSCAEDKGWSRLRLTEIAAEADLSLADVAEHFANKQAILDAFVDAVDQEVLRKADPDPAETARDRVFDVIMTRFEVLIPFRPALKRIARDLGPTPGQGVHILAQFARSQTWMLRAAGIDVDGPTAGLRVSGLMSVYAQVLPVWMEDDDPGLARTMATLDRRLRRGERWLVRLEGIGGTLARLAGRFAPKDRSAAPTPSPETPPSPPTANGSADQSIH